MIAVTTFKTTTTTKKKKNKKKKKKKDVVPENCRQSSRIQRDQIAEVITPDMMHRQVMHGSGRNFLEEEEFKSVLGF